MHLRRFYNLVEARGQRAIASTYASQLARSLCGLGRYDEAETLARIGRATDETKQDILAQTLWRRVQALVHSSRDQHLEAAALAVEAVAIMEPTDALNMQGDTLRDLAQVLHAADRGAEAEAALAQALERYERKHNLARAAQVRERLAALQAPTA